MTLATDIKPIEGAEAWLPAKLVPADYTIELSADEIAELEAFNRKMDAEGKGLDEVEAEDFDCPKLKQTMKKVWDELQHGRGFLIMSGLPVDRWSQEDVERAYWGMGTTLGNGLVQSVMGERLGHVRDATKVENDPHARAYRNSDKLNPHTDYCDILSLCCIKGAKEGGLSQLTSMASVHNALLKNRPDVLERLYQGFHYHRRGEEGPGDDPVTPYKIPVFSDTDGKISSRWIKTFIEMGQRELGEPLEGFEEECVELLWDYQNDPTYMFEFMTQPGQIQWVNNLNHVHSRTAFVDHDDPDERRHLLRLWLNNDAFRPKSKTLEIYEGGAGIVAQKGRTPSFNEKKLEKAKAGN